MCMIVDADQLGSFLAEPSGDAAAPIRSWLARPHGAGKLVYSTGGKFNELGHNVRAKLADYARAGQARLVPAGEFAAKRSELEASGRLCSNDSHVLALALESRCRLLYTKDKALIKDFKNPSIIKRPRGKVYSGAANANLLTASACTL